MQLPNRIGAYGTQARMSQDQLVACLIHISRYRFSLVISGLTKMLQRVNEAVSTTKINYTELGSIILQKKCGLLQGEDAVAFHPIII